MEKAIAHRPADDIPNEFAKLEAEAKKELGTQTVSVEDVLTYAMFPKVAPKFFAERKSGPVVFAAPSSAAPGSQAASGTSPAVSGPCIVTVNGTDYRVDSSRSGASLNLTVNGTPYAVSFKDSIPAAGSATPAAGSATPAAGSATPAAGPSGASGPVSVLAPVSGTLLKQLAQEGSSVVHGQPLFLIESMKMELEIKAAASGILHYLVPPGTPIAAGKVLAEIIG